MSTETRVPRSLALRPDGLWRTFFLVILCLSLTFCLSQANWQKCWVYKVGHRLESHELVLAQQATAPQQYNRWVPSVLCQLAHDRLGLDLAKAHAIWCGLGYLVVLIATWYWLECLGVTTGGIILGLLALTTYGYYMLTSSGDNPTDMYGAALFALCLAFLGRDRMWPVCLAATVAGFLWTKQVFLGPIVLLFYVTKGEWRKGLLTGLLAGICTGIGPAVYLAIIGYHPITPGGILTTSAFIAAIPKSMMRHLPFAAPPLLSYLLLRGRLPLVLRVATLIYPMMLFAYVVGHLWVFEMRAWWVVTPVFAALLASWCLPEEAQPAPEPRDRGKRPALL